MDSLGPGEARDPQRSLHNQICWGSSCCLPAKPCHPHQTLSVLSNPATWPVTPPKLWPLPNPVTHPATPSNPVTSAKPCHLSCSSCWTLPNPATYPATTIKLCQLPCHHYQTLSLTLPSPPKACQTLSPGQIRPPGSPTGVPRGLPRWRCVYSRPWPPCKGSVWPGRPALNPPDFPEGKGASGHRGRVSGRHSQVQEELDFLAGAIPTAAEAAHGGGEQGTRRHPDPTAPGDGAEMAAAPPGRRAWWEM